MKDLEERTGLIRVVEEWESNVNHTIKEIRK
jgi:hypothetical protein